MVASLASQVFVMLVLCVALVCGARELKATVDAPAPAPGSLRWGGFGWQQWGYNNYNGWGYQPYYQQQNQNAVIQNGGYNSNQNAVIQNSGGSNQNAIIQNGGHSGSQNAVIQNSGYGQSQNAVIQSGRH